VEAATVSRERGLFVDVGRDLDGSLPGCLVVDVLIDRVARHEAEFVVLNFHDRRTVPSECLRLITAIETSTHPVPIVLTEAGEEVRLSLVDTGHLPPDLPGPAPVSSVIAPAASR